MGQTDYSKKFVIYNISLHYDIQFYFNKFGIQKITQIFGKNINPITFHFAEEGPGRGSEDIKTECDVKCFDFCFFSVFLMDVICHGKITISLKELR